MCRAGLVAGVDISVSRRGEALLAHITAVGGVATFRSRKSSGPVLVVGASVAPTLDTPAHSRDEVVTHGHRERSPHRRTV